MTAFLQPEHAANGVPRKRHGMIRFVPTPISATLRGVVFAVGGLACFAIVIAAALFAVGMTLVLVAARPIAAFRSKARAHDAGRLEAAPVP